MNMRGAQCGYVQEHAIDVGDTPDLGGFDVERIRIAVRGEPRVHGRFLSELYVSGELPLSATAFTSPPGVLAAGKRYVFQVMLEDLEDGTLENRSIAFSEPYVVARQEAPGELNSALSRSPRNFDRMDFRVVD
jgi:hypothetical protein